MKFSEFLYMTPCLFRPSPIHEVMFLLSSVCFWVSKNSTNLINTLHKAFWIFRNSKATQGLLSVEDSRRVTSFVNIPGLSLQNWEMSVIVLSKNDLSFILLLRKHSTRKPKCKLIITIVKFLIYLKF